MKNRLRRLERKAEGHYIIIPQLEGPPAKFPASAAQEAFLVSLARLKGEDVPIHPLSVAAENSSDSQWRRSFVAGTHRVVGGEIPEDLSEP
jgi:hypothetical protein